MGAKACSLESNPVDLDAIFFQNHLKLQGGPGGREREFLRLVRLCLPGKGVLKELTVT